MGKCQKGYKWSRKTQKCVLKSAVGGKLRLQQFCNTYPNHPDCKNNKKAIIEMVTGSSVDKTKN